MKDQLLVVLNRSIEGIDDDVIKKEPDRDRKNIEGSQYVVQLVPF
jgi:hypothetical protein